MNIQKSKYFILYEFRTFVLSTVNIVRSRCSLSEHQCSPLSDKLPSPPTYLPKEMGDALDEIESHEAGMRGEVDMWSFGGWDYYWSGDGHLWRAESAPDIGRDISRPYEWKGWVITAGLWLVVLFGAVLDALVIYAALIGGQ